MKVEIVVMYTRECVVEIPDDKATDASYLADLPDLHEGEFSPHAWDGTYITNADTDEELASW